MKTFNKKILSVIAALTASIFLLAYFSFEDEINYSSDVKPILNKNCIHCHGGVKAKGGFSVLFREDALAKLESGKYAIVPGEPGESEMIRRIKESNPEERMPYNHEPLSKKDIRTLTLWIKQGAKWGNHWAYLPVGQIPLPSTDNDWIINDVDRFILTKLEELKLQPAPKADKATLLRRVSLDLIGMYPSQSIATQFLNSTADNAYQQLVDSLLTSKHFGERWATMWLDLSRYADTKGYEADRARTIWKYRDWVIDAFNRDMPYDRFLTEQIAGDLLPDARDAQYIATAFHRNTMTNDEGGTDNEEFRTAAVMDRTSTTWEALMGTTFSCVQCHSHPYDPFRHQEYYSFLAYFNNTRDEDQSPEYPFLRIYNDTVATQVEKITEWVKKHSTTEDANAMKLFLRTLQPSFYGSAAVNITNGFIDGNNGPLVLTQNGSSRYKNIDLKGINNLIFHYYTRKPGGVITLHLDSVNGPVIGKQIVPAKTEAGIFSFDIQGDNKVHDVYVTYANNSIPAKDPNNRIYFEWFAFTKDLPGKGLPGYEENKKIFLSLLTKPVDKIPVMVENPAAYKRKTYVFERGNRLTLGEEVQPRVPNTFAAAMPANAPKDRRGLAMWLTSKKNPLVSRTLVNRLWEQMFGTGIVETLEDMGTQGSLPTHQELLDYYSWKLMNEYGWSVKRLLKEFVMSATYRQDSRFTQEANNADPYNKYYARGPRVRLSAEQLRDQHLCISGVISKKMYGPGVMPWQPEGIWNNPYNEEKWTNSEGEDQYRRAVYTYIKRSAPYPSLATFDGTSRVVCTPRRIRTNTPLQALATLNDSVYIDLATQFSARMMKEGGSNLRSRIEKGYEAMLFKKIPADKLSLLMNLYNNAMKHFSTNEKEAQEFCGVTSPGKDIPDKAAMKMVANTMLNLDEVITKN
jgi:hypothetical protein